jgi:2-polyprenyl-3-methyl-5-hydroxy-6-metoxy-1,4-benzoquinol methylase
MSVTSIEREIAAGQRFKFGENWNSFLGTINEAKVVQAQRCLLDLVGGQDLTGKSFLDIGCGSGLSSLVARRAGAVVRSFDYDPQSVGCTKELKQRFLPDDADWTISTGSILDQSFLATLPRFDIVYSWGVLHHTGRMWTAIENAAARVAEGGILAIAIYNDQGLRSRIWRSVKHAYNRSPTPLRSALLTGSMLVLWGPATIKGLVLHAEPLRWWRRYQSSRGMSPWHDLVDWVGGYPFEVATPAHIIERVQAMGYALQRCNLNGGIGCNEFAFTRCSIAPEQS